MMETHLVKSVNVDRRSKKRLRFATSKQKSKLASADVYRRRKRRIGATGTATREADVHHAPAIHDAGKRMRPETPNDLPLPSETQKDSIAEETLDVVSDETTFAQELDLAMERNASSVFQRFYHDVWPLVRSLPELVHHAENVVDTLLRYLLSPEDKPEQVSMQGKLLETTGVCRYQVNHATIDILHLLAVYARDLRYEVHPWLHTRIMPRIIGDLLNPPLPASGKQPIPLDATIVEAAFRAIGYILRYDAERLLEESSSNAKQGEQPCLEPMRSYYGATLANKRELIRRLSAETFAPLVRRLKSESARCRHVRRVLRALDASAADQSSMPGKERLREDAIDGITQFCLEVAKGVSGDLNSKGEFVVNCVLTSAMVDGRSLSCEVASSFCRRLVVALKPETAERLLVNLKSQVSAMKKEKDAVADKYTLSASFLLRLTAEILSNGGDVLARYGKDCAIFIIEEMSQELFVQKMGVDFQESIAKVWCVAWNTLHNEQDVLIILRRILSKWLGTIFEGTHCSCTSFNGVVTKHVLYGLHPERAMSHVGSVLLEAALMTKCDEEFFPVVHGVASFRVEHDSTVHYDDDTFFPRNAQMCNLEPAVVSSLLDRILLPFHDVLKNIHQFTVAAKCAAFVGACRADQTHFAQSYRRVASWLSALALLISNEPYEQTSKLVLCFSSSVEALALLSSIALDRSLDKETIEPQLMGVRRACEKVLIDHSSSICILKSCAAYCRLGNRLSFHISDDFNSVFEALTPNLYNPGHFKRLHTLQILATFPKKPFVVDHADLDLADDLEEEPNLALAGNGGTGPVGVCSLIDSLVVVESLPVDLESERTMASLLSKIEVLGRSGKLPILYADAVVCHLMGLLHVKFSPMWIPTIKALSAIVHAHGRSSWPFILDRLSILTGGDDEHYAKQVVPGESQPNGFDLDAHFTALQLWESSGGLRLTLFADAVRNANDKGKVSVFESREPCDASLSLWQLLENQPGLIVERSRDIVPLVLNYFQFQHFAPEAPDSREIFVDVPNVASIDP